MRVLHSLRGRAAFAVLLAALGAACASTPNMEPQHAADVDPLVSNASAELVCPPSHLTLVRVDEDRKSVEGCGLKAQYERACRNCAYKLEGTIARLH